MTDVATLTQADADRLLALEKHQADDQVWVPSRPGWRITVSLMSVDGHEPFLLDLRRGRIDILKSTCQTRGRKVVVLARLDIGGPPHRNPDDEVIRGSHLHLYREGFGDRWAFPVPASHFADLSDAKRTLQDFLAYCNVTQTTLLQRPRSEQTELF